MEQANRLRTAGRKLSSNNVQRPRAPSMLHRKREIFSDEETGLP